jgi:hypothetical protein
MNTIQYKPKEEAQYIGEVTDEQIKAWKDANPKGIYRVISDDGHVGYFRNPYRGDVSYALTQADAKRPLATVEAFGKMTLLGGSDEILGDNCTGLGVVEHLRSKMNGTKARLENL